MRREKGRRGKERGREVQQKNKKINHRCVTPLFPHILLFLRIFEGIFRKNREREKARER